MGEALSSIIPKAEDLDQVGPEDRARAIMRILLSLPQNDSNFHLTNFLNGPYVTGGYPPERHEEARSFASAGWRWLELQGYVKTKQGSNDPNWIEVAPGGRRWYGETPFTGKKKPDLNVDPQESPRPTVLPFAPGGRITGDLAELLARAILLGEQSSGPSEYTFTSLLLAFLTQMDLLSMWFQNYTEHAGIFVDSILSYAKLQPGDLQNVRSRRLTKDEVLQISRRTAPSWTTSEDSVLNQASRLLQRTSSGNEALDVRHVMGAYIYSPIGHEQLLRDWGFNLEDWASSFMDYLATAYRSEADHWMTIHLETFSREPRLPYKIRPLSATDDKVDSTSSRTPASDETRESPDEGGPSTHVACDRWTLDDALNYYPYSYAIYRFLTNRETIPPLTISIQAPWGAGKSSLMRMIQSQLDPDFAKASEVAPQHGNVSARVRDILDELNQPSQPRWRRIREFWRKYRSGRRPESNSSPAQPAATEVLPRRATIWFNAWKYESASQIWAGLTDAIVRQVGEHLGPIRREIFWFQLHLRRVGSGKVREKIHGQILGLFVGRAIPFLWLYILAPLLSSAAALSTHLLNKPGSERWQHFFWGALVVSLGLDTIGPALQYRAAKSKIANETAQSCLGELVETPDYSASLGFIHHVVEDLKKVFACIPSDQLPMVIFIDDLDRCSPNRIADVVEAINLFLAGEFPQCMFVLGIDDEMVAAALDKAHSDVIERLPPYAKFTSIGRRFMDKFVQLPFIVPTPSPSDLERYLHSLLSHDAGRKAIDMRARNEVASQILSMPRGSEPTAIAEQVAKIQKLSDEQLAELKTDVEIIHEMNRNIESFSDTEKRVQDLMVEVAKTFSNNPRDLKRFINVFRFQYFLRAARKARGEPVASDRQLIRWVVLTLRWPEVARWLRRVSLVQQFSTGAATSQPTKTILPLESLETHTKDSSSSSEWKTKVFGDVPTNGEPPAWLEDNELFRFFEEEAKHYEGFRLSRSGGTGLW